MTFAGEAALGGDLGGGQPNLIDRLECRGAEPPVSGSAGELASYTQLSDESRQKAVNRMIQMAARLEGNAIINVDFELSFGGQSQGGGGASVVVHGTAVVIRPIKGYVPTGAVGNILAEISDTLEKK